MFWDWVRLILENWRYFTRMRFTRKKKPTPRDTRSLGSCFLWRCANTIRRCCMVDTDPFMLCQDVTIYHVNTLACACLMQAVSYLPHLCSDAPKYFIFNMLAVCFITKHGKIWLKSNRIHLESMFGQSSEKTSCKKVDMSRDAETHPHILCIIHTANLSYNVKSNIYRYICIFQTVIEHFFSVSRSETEFKLIHSFN